MTIDTTKPNSARIYDYALGGKHNYPADRAAAKQLFQVFPEFPQVARLYRYFLHIVAARLAKADLANYLDLATGIPTEGYLHELVPPTAKIIYNDIDPETVAYAQQIVGDQPNIRCIQSDLRAIDAILAQAETFFGSERKIGVFLVNVSYLIDDAALAQVFQRLYDWCAPGSMLALSGSPPSSASAERSQQVRDFYARIGTPIYNRTPEELIRLAAPWQVALPMQTIEEYAEQSLGGRLLPNEAIRGDVGYGGILIR